MNHEDEMQRHAFQICCALSIVEDRLNNDFAEQDIANKIRECRLEVQTRLLNAVNSIALDALLYKEAGV
ncbi:hypothetical protein R83H12_00410 [Fibrobacteria bacterium R8-3-H12]